MRIELQDTFNKALKDGVNLFLGAGFSLYAEDSNGDKLPLGSELADELIDQFSCPKVNDLSKICTIIDSTNAEGLSSYLRSRFAVEKFPPFYNSIIDINCNRIYTTNIDDLVDCIYAQTNEKYINNIFVNGLCHKDSSCIDYIPLHGSIHMPDVKLLFNKQEVTGSYRSQLHAWSSLNLSTSQFPSVFVGYSLEDIGAIEALFSDDAKIPQKDKWILLHEENEGSEAYFKALGFRIIVGDVKDFLLYVNSLNLKSKTTPKDNKLDSIEIIFKDACVPKSNYKGRIRQIDEFFLGAAPIWSDILSNRVHQTLHVDEIRNMVESDKNLIVTGIPASGKSTILFQLAHRLSNSRRILIFSGLSLNKSNIIRNEIKQKTLILVDNFTTDIESFLNLTNNPHIQLVGFERYYNVDLSAHKLPISKFNYYDVSDISKLDAQSIYQSIPLTIRKPKPIYRRRDDEIPSVFEIVNYNINKPDLNDRYRSILDDLDQSDPTLLDLLIMTCYVHACRTPVSYEVVSSFLGESVDNYNEVLEMMDSLSGMVDEAIDGVSYEIDNDQDYYQPRSQVLAETILEQTKGEYFSRVYKQFHESVPKHQIPNFYVFKRSAYDASFVSKAYYNWKEGYEFYKYTYEIDRNPFLLQQCALYLLKKRRYTEAALTIDRALQTSKKRFFSIENTHAIILFKANINSTSSDSQIRATLDKSMEILKQCYAEDKRKIYHVTTYAEQALEYFKKYPDQRSIDNLNTAKNWLEKMLQDRKYHRRSKGLLSQIQRIL